MASPVKNYHDSLTGAPALTGTAGSLIALLDACLVYGFNLVTLDGLAITDGVLIGTKAGHGFFIDQVISTAGAGQAVLNAEWTVTEVTSSTFKASATGQANVVGTGIITAKAAPAGWEKVFSGSNRAVYRSADPSSTRHYLRVDDTPASYAAVRGYMVMTDVDSGTGPFPSATEYPTATWPKSNDSGARPWSIFADAALFYYLPNPTASGSGALAYAFGQIGSNKPDDQYATLLAYTNVTYSDAASALSRPNRQPWYYNSFLTLAGGWGQLGIPVLARIFSLAAIADDVSGGNNQAFQAINPVDGGISIFPVYYCDNDNSGIRGDVSGLYHTFQNRPAPDRTILRSPAGMAGRNVFFKAVTNSGQTGYLIFDMTGPWR